MNATIKLLLRKDFTKKDGSQPVYLRLIINRKIKYYSVGISLYESDLLKKDKLLVKSSIENSSLINLQLSDAETKAIKILNDFTRYNIRPTFSEFENKFKRNLSRTSFYQYAKSYVENNSEISKETEKTYTTQLSKLTKFISETKQSFDEINNLDFIESYKKYMIKDLENKLNTYYKSLTFIKTILNHAKKNSIIQKNVFDTITIRKEPGNRLFLTYEEILKLEKYYYSKKISKKHKNVLSYFLFSCFTGLRYTDVKNLEHGNFSYYKLKKPINGKQQQLMLDLKMHKTQRYVTISVIGKAKKLISFTNSYPEKKVFKCLSNQKTNKYIKEIMLLDDIKINKSISFHCSRHSFATQAIRMGIPMKTVSQILGHTEIKTTEIYTHYIKDDIIKSMERAF